MSNFTHKSWHVVEGRTVGSIEIFSGETAIAEMWRRGDKSAELANAQLMAAAPDLLKQRDELLVELKATESRLHEVSAFCATVWQQRDELLDALKDMLGQFNHDSVHDESEVIAKAKAAIALVGKDTQAKCECDFRQRTVGDGCAVCNPELAADYAEDESRDGPTDRSAAQVEVCWEVLNGICSYGFYGTKDEAEKVCADMQKSHDLSGSLAAFNVRPVYNKARGE